jgi:hypothetical protein
MKQDKKCIHADPLIRNPPQKLSLGEKKHTTCTIDDEKDRDSSRKMKTLGEHSSWRTM